MSPKVYENQNSSIKDKVKYTVWTSPMDNCLSKILADYAKECYKGENIIKPATYAAAVEALNEKFGLELNKEHVKNRLKTLKKQYAVLREILAQKGFKWDKTRKTVIANDATWKEYIKVNPDAKSFRSRTFENYDEMGIILGNDRALASCSDNDTEGSVDIMSENFENAIDFEFQSDEKPTKNLRWTEEMDTCLGEVLAEQVHKGYKLGHALHTEAYEVAVKALDKEFGPGLSKDNIKNRLKTWRKQYSIVNELISHGGFKWDATQRMIVGDDSLWNAFIEKHQDARTFRGKVIENYEHLFTIFGNTDLAGRFPRNRNTLAADCNGVEPINALPLRCWSSEKYELKNITWTQDMDCCLSMILVEQQSLGNKDKLETKFKPAAYDVAVSTLSERFQFDFTKEHIKNRIQMWKRLYESVKELLEQSGFSWDEKRKMIIADDSVWHDYTKVKSDAMLLRGRVISNYDDLHVIFGHDDQTKCSRQETEKDLDSKMDNDAEAEFLFQTQGGNAVECRKYTVWTNEMDRCLTEELLKQVKLGNKLEKHFKPMAYVVAANSLNDKFSLGLTKENVTNHLKTWERLYRLVKELLSCREFKWDDKLKMVVTSESMWNEYIKKNPDAKSLRGRCIENYDALRIIIGSDKLIGYWSTSGANGEEYPGTGMADANEQLTSEGTQGSSRQTGGARPSSSSHSKQPSKKRCTSDGIIEMMRAMAANIGRIADALTENNQPVCLDELFEMVQNIPGFDDDLIIEACEFLAFDEKRAKMFLKLDERLRKLWLIKRLRSNNI